MGNNMMSSLPTTMFVKQRLANARNVQYFGVFCNIPQCPITFFRCNLCA